MPMLSPFKSVRVLLAVCALASFLAACGQKGDLYFPDGEPGERGVWPRTKPSEDEEPVE